MEIPLFPLMVYYFGIPFVIIMTGLMIIASIVQGHVVELIERQISNET
jgi:hypothetical protein